MNNKNSINNNNNNIITTTGEKYVVSNGHVGKFRDAHEFIITAEMYPSELANQVYEKFMYIYPLEFFKNKFVFEICGIKIPMNENNKPFGKFINRSQINNEIIIKNKDTEIVTEEKINNYDPTSKIQLTVRDKSLNLINEENYTFDCPANLTICVLATKIPYVFSSRKKYSEFILFINGKEYLITDKTPIGNLTKTSSLEVEIIDTEENRIRREIEEKESVKTKRINMEREKINKMERKKPMAKERLFGLIEHFYDKNNLDGIKEIFSKYPSLINTRNKDNITPIMLSCLSTITTIEVFKLLIKNGADLNLQDKDGNTALMRYFDNFNWKDSRNEVCKLLLSNGANPKICNKNGKIPLMRACEWKNENFVKMFIEYGAYVNQKDEDDKTVLMYACEIANIGISKMILEQGAIISQCDKNGKTALMYACGVNAIEISKMLLGNGAIINQKDKNGKTSLMYACGYGWEKSKLLKFLIENGANQDIQDENGYTAIMHFLYSQSLKKEIYIVTESENIEAAKNLIENGANLNLQDKDGNTALSHCCFCLNTRYNNKIIELLLLNGANTSYHNKNNRISIADIYDKCSRWISVENIKLLIENGADINKENEDGNNALMMACKDSDIDVVKLIIEKGTDINKQNKNKYTALMMACKYANVDIVEFLLLKGADPNCPNNDGFTPLMMCVQPYCSHDYKEDTKNSIMKIKLLLKQGANPNLQNKDGKTVLNVISEARGRSEWGLRGIKLSIYYKEAIEALLENRADPNHQDKYGNTAIMVYIKNVCGFCNYQDNIDLSYEIIKLLISNGADPNMSLACVCSHVYANITIVNFLIEKCTDINYQDKNGTTPLMRACENRNDETVELLLENNANINQSDNYGKTSLMYACKSGNEEIIKLLIEKGANINQQDEDKNSALMISLCKWYIYSRVEILLSKGANPDLQNKNGETAIMKACRDHNTKSIQILINYKCNPNIMDKNKNTVLMYFAKYLKYSHENYEEMVRMLSLNGAKFNLENKKGWTALEYARRKDNKIMVNILKKYY